MPALLPIHILGAAVGLVSGAVALAAVKGRWLHRKSGVIFVYAMLAMCIPAVVIALGKGQIGNVLAGSLTAYLAVTGLTTVRPPSNEPHRWNLALMILALAVGTVTLVIGLMAFGKPGRTMFGLPAYPFLLFGFLGLSSGAGDWRIVRSGPLAGARRLRRHLWRMCTALFIAAASFFSIRSRVAAIFPAPFTAPLARLLPVLLVLAVMFYWLWRVRSRTMPARA